PPPPTPASYRPDRILVRLKHGSPPAALTNLNSATGCRILRHFPRLKNWMVLELPSHAPTAQMIARYRRSGIVAHAEPDFTVHLALTPDDFRYWDGTLWGLHNVGLYGGTPGADIHAPEAWDQQYLATNV